MRKIYFVFILLALNCFSQQSKIDSLSVLINTTENSVDKAKLLIKRSKAYPQIQTDAPYKDAEVALALAKKENNATLQIEAYNQLSVIANRNDDYQKAMHFDELALKVAENENNVVGIVNAYKNISKNQKSLGKIKESVISAERAKEIAVNNNLTQEYAGINNALGVAYRNNKQFEESIKVLDEGINQTKNKKTLAVLYMNKANTLTELVRLDEAIDNHLQSLKINEELKDDKGKLQVYNNLGGLFKKAKQYDKAISYYNKSLQLATKNNVESSIALSYDNLATVYDLAKKKDSIVYFRQKAITIFKKIEDKKNEARAYHNLGNYYLLHNKLAEAEKYLKIALAKRTQIDVSGDIASSKTALGNVYDKQKKFDEAETLLLSAKEMLKGVANDKKEDLLKALAEHYKLKGELETALKTQNEQLRLKDSLLHNSEVVNVLKKENNYILNKKESEINSLKAVESNFQTNKPERCL